ncbi:MAG TPA: prepilin-type N-terminal cleavage/methylation domain-containing protein [Chthoniobacterales bacterium]
MFIVRADRRRTLAFTLLEVTLAVAILGMMALAIYRFVSTNLTAVRLSTELNESDARYQGLANLLNEQLQDLPPGQGALAGEPFKFSGRSRDEMSWTCSAGPGLLTRYATGDYLVTLRLRPMQHGDAMELGIVREADDDDENPVPDNKEWVSLLNGVNSMEIRYFDPRLNAWVDRWTDRSTLPHLVRLTIDRVGSSVPWETILALRRSPL